MNIDQLRDRSIESLSSFCFSHQPYNAWMNDDDDEG